MKLKTVLRTTGLALGFALLAACASNPTKVGDVWVAPGLTSLQATRAVVVALAPTEAARRRMETEMSMRLTRVNATDSNIILSSDELRDPTKAVAKLKAAGYDKAIVMRLIEAQGHTIQTPQTLPQQMGQQPYYTKTTSMQATNYVIETTIFDVVDGKPLVRVTTETFQTADPSVLAARLFDSVSNELRTRGLIQ
jgi:hypothetical protein